MQSSHCCFHCIGSSRLSSLFRHTVGQWRSWALTQVYGMPVSMLLPLCHAADGLWDLGSLKLHQGEDKNFWRIWFTLSFPSSKTNNHNPISHQTNATPWPPTGTAAPGPGRRAAISSDVTAPNPAQPTGSQLTNGHNFFNASKLFMNEQGGAVVTPKPLWLETE